MTGWGWRRRPRWRGLRTKWTSKTGMYLVWIDGQMEKSCAIVTGKSVGAAFNKVVNSMREMPDSDCRFHVQIMDRVNLYLREDARKRITLQAKDSARFRKAIANISKQQLDNPVDEARALDQVVMAHSRTHALKFQFRIYGNKLVTFIPNAPLDALTRERFARLFMHVHRDAHHAAMTCYRVRTDSKGLITWFAGGKFQVPNVWVEMDENQSDWEYPSYDFCRYIRRKWHEEFVISEAYPIGSDMILDRVLGVTAIADPDMATWQVNIQSVYDGDE